MSSYVDREWFYYLRGREILIYKIQGGTSTQRITQSGVFQSYDKELMYPDEDISEGLRIEYTKLGNAFIVKELEQTTDYTSGTTIYFDGATIRDSASGFKFSQSDKVRVRGSASNDGEYLLTSSGTVNAGTITRATGTFTTETAGERIIVQEISVADGSPSTSSHINLNKMLSLAVLDYCRGQLAEYQGDMNKKEYYMKEFFSKLGDNESNKRNISVTFPSGVYAVK